MKYKYSEECSVQTYTRSSCYTGVLKHSGAFSVATSLRHPCWCLNIKATSSRHLQCEKSMADAFSESPQHDSEYTSMLLYDNLLLLYLLS